MFLRQLPRIFTWQEPSPELVALHERYVLLLSARLGQLLGRLQASAPDRAGAIAALVGGMDNRVLARTLAAPEVSYRLLWPAHHEDGQAAAFLLASLQAADAAARGMPVAGGAWLAAGDAWVDAKGRLTQPWGDGDGLPLDCGSPHALAVDVSGEAIRSPRAREPLAPAALRCALAKLAVAVAHTRESAPHAWTMARSFTKALILMPDDAAPGQFASGSSGQFVGRSVLSNPQLAKVGEVELAEALVHEAIHAVLYMDEQHDPWVLDPALYAGPMRIVSPWTGNRLPLRPFLQAAFVWYGLLAFWSVARAAGVFPDEAVRLRLNQAAAGFLRVDLTGQVAPVADRLAPELLAAVAELQQGVRATLESAEAAC